MGNLFQELRRRKVFRVAAVYAVVAWLLIQVADTLFPALQLPDWTVTFVTVLFMLGFPIALVLAWAYELSSDGVHSDSGPLAQSRQAPPQNQALVYATFILVLVVAGFQIADRFVFQAQPDTSDQSEQPDVASNLVRRSLVDIGSTTVVRGVSADITLSQDGRRLAYAVRRSNGDPVSELWLRELDQLESRLLAALPSDRITLPFFSPDGEWIGYFDRVDNELYKMSIRSGNPQLLARNITALMGGSWHSDGFIYLTDDQAPGRLLRVSAEGNRIEPLNEDDETRLWHVWPQVLPDGDAAIFNMNIGNFGDSTALVNLQSGEIKTLIDNSYAARYVPTGHIVFVRGSSLWAVPFDLETKELSGGEVVVVQDIEAQPGGRKATYAFSSEGTLLYLPQRSLSEIEDSSESIPRSLVWVDRNGNEEPLPAATDFRNHVTSPDGRQLAMVTKPALTANFDIWTYDLTSGRLDRRTFDEGIDRAPLWTPDSARIVFYSSREGGGLWWKDATGSSEPTLLLSTPDAPPRPFAFTPDGTQLVYEYRGDLFLYSFDADPPTEQLTDTEFQETSASISPDGLWIAYESNESGENEIYVRSFPDMEGIRQVSLAGGFSPIWSPNGNALFYRSGLPRDSSVWEVKLDMTVDGGLRFDSPVQLFSGNYAHGGSGSAQFDAFDISSDGSRFLLVRDTMRASEFASTESTQLVMVDNWFEELTRLAPRRPN